MDVGILQVKEYGSVKINLRPLMEARGLSRNRLAHLIDTRYEVVNKWYNGRVERIDADILARLCYVLQCEVSDIIFYVPGSKSGF